MLVTKVQGSRLVCADGYGVRIGFMVSTEKQLESNVEVMKSFKKETVLRFIDAFKNGKYMWLHNGDNLQSNGVLSIGCQVFTKRRTGLIVRKLEKIYANERV